MLVPIINQEKQSILTTIGTITYTVVYFRFRGFITKTLQTKELPKEFNLVKTTVKVNVICFGIILIVNCIYASLFNFSLKLIKIGGFNWIQLLVEISYTLSLISLSYMSYYVHKVINNLIRKD